MAIQWIAERLRNRIHEFAASRDGNVAMIFAIASLPLFAAMGIAIDYSRANAVKTDMQAALDAAALMVSKTAATMTGTELQTAAQNFFDAQFKNPAVLSWTVTATYDSASSTVKLDGASAMKTDFLGVMGSKFSQLPITGTSSVSWGNSRLRVAIALDNTGSMQTNNKMTALKTAAKNLITQLQSAAQKNGDVYVSIVPFAKDVNIGSGNVSATWLNWNIWDANGSCSKGKYKNKAECIANAETWTPDLAHSVWTGCITDRDQEHDALNTAPVATNVSTLFVPEQYGDCPVAMMPLSYDWTALKNKIDAMDPKGNTNVTIGMSLAWQSLTSGVPFSPPAEESGYKYQKVVILLTDGDNTQNRWSSTQADIDARTKKACDNAKAAGITIYTVLVMQGSQSLLQACATDASKYFFLQSASELVTAFNQIGTDLSNFRVSK